MKTAILVLTLTVAALVSMESLEAASSGYRMFVNHGAGWSAAGDFRTLEECKRAAFLYFEKHSVQTGCSALSLLEQQERQRADARFQQAAAECAKEVGIGIIHKPGRRFDIFGTARERFEFDKCMADRGQPTEKVPDPIRIVP